MWNAFDIQVLYLLCKMNETYIYILFDELSEQVAAMPNIQKAMKELFCLFDIHMYRHFYQSSTPNVSQLFCRCRYSLLFDALKSDYIIENVKSYFICCETTTLFP